MVLVVTQNYRCQISLCEVGSKQSHPHGEREGSPIIPVKTIYDISRLHSLAMNYPVNLLINLAIFNDPTKI